jgi:hypothetical protein
MTNDDVVLSKMMTFGLHLMMTLMMGSEQMWLFICTILPPNLVHPIARNYGSSMAHASSLNVMLLALGQQAFSQQSLGLG